MFRCSLDVLLECMLEYFPIIATVGLIGIMQSMLL